MGVLSGKAALVTGSAAGIGKALAQRLSADGARVAIADIDSEAAELVARELDGIAVAMDVTDSASVDRAVAGAIDRLGHIDIVVNNAGVHIQKLLVDLEDGDWDQIMNTNARGCFYVCRSAAPHLIEQGSGRIINIITRLGGNPFSSAYIASKSAIWGLTQCLALELADHGVTVNAIAPGHVGPGTGMEKWFREKARMLDQDWQTFEENVLGSIPLGRWCKTEDVASAVSFLASPEASFITAEQLNVTGGWSGYGTAKRRSKQ